MRRFGKGFKTVSSCTMTGGRKNKNVSRQNEKRQNEKNQKKEKKSF